MKLLVSYTGASPWSVLAQGISNYVDLSIGTITFFISLFVIILWIFLSQKPGIGTFLNVIIIAVMIDVCLNNVTTPEFFELKIFDTSGREVFNKPIKKGGKTNFELHFNDDANLSPGVYFYTLITDNTFYSGKIIQR